MFAKHWQPGKVKPRLAQALGESHAAMLHGLFVLVLVERFATMANRRQIAFSPADCERAFACVAKGRWELTPQSDGELGQRMQIFFDETLRQAERVVLIGSDCPDLPRKYLDEAFAALDNHAVVLGPSANGGCYLIGVRRRVPPIFADIAWSAPDVGTQTTQRLLSAGIAWHELPQWYDVEEEADLRTLAGRLHSATELEPRLVQLRRELNTLLGPDLRRPTRSHQ
jgi:rSAM/selenodomain-associated transferase 1